MVEIWRVLYSNRFASEVQRKESPSLKPLVGGTMRRVPKSQKGGTTAMSEQSARVAPLVGTEYAVPWPTPPLPGTSMLTFWGNGDQTSESFTLPCDASVRIAVETGPFALRVLNPDGTDATTLAPIPDGGLALGAIPHGGTYTLEVKAPARWGVTVVFGSSK
jgi:hypothetical protein